MIAIVTAGGKTQPGEPLYEITQGGYKTMLLLNGKPMVQWVLDALSQTEQIQQVIVVGLPLETDLVCTHPLQLLPDEGGMLNNIRAGAKKAIELDPTATHALLLSGDVPGVNAEIIEWILEQSKALDLDLYYSIIDRTVMEAHFPKSKRTYVHLKEMQVCGGDVHCLRLRAVVDESPLWKKLINSRKSPFRQASLVGYDTLFFLMLRQLRLKDAEAMLCKRLGVQAKAVLCPYPQVGMDIDKPFQLEIMREYLTPGL